MTPKKNDREQRREIERGLLLKAQAGDQTARDELVKRNMGIVFMVAKKYYSNRFSLEDSVQDGVVGLLIAINKFDLRKDVMFNTYAFHWIRCYITGALIQGLTTIDEQRAFFKGHAAASALFARGEAVTDEAVGKELGVKASAVGSVRAKHSPVKEILLSEPDDKESAESKVIREQTEGFVHAAVNKLRRNRPRLAELVRRRYLLEDTETLQQVGDHFGLSRERVRQIELDAKSRLKRALKAVA